MILIYLSIKIFLFRVSISNDNENVRRRSFRKSVSILGAIVVSTSQKAALQVTRRGLTMFEKLNIPVIGLIHNMSHIQCSNCSKLTSMFGDHLLEFSRNASKL